MAIPSAGLTCHFATDAITGVADGNPVMQWNDLSGGNRHATAPASHTAPVYLTEQIDDKPALRFTASQSHRMSTPTFTGQALPYVMVMVGRIHQLGTGDQTMIGTNEAIVTRRHTAERLEMYSWNAALGLPTVVPLRYLLIVAEFNGGSSRLRINGQTIAEGSAGSRPSGSVFHIGHGGAFQYANLDIVEAAFYQASLSSAARDQLEGHLLDKYALMTGLSAALVSDDLTGGGFVNPRNMLIAQGHAVTGVTTANAPSHDFSGYDLVMANRVTVNDNVAAALRAAYDAGKPFILGGDRTTTSNDDGILRRMEVAAENVLGGSGSQTTTGLDVRDNDHPITQGMSLGHVTLHSAQVASWLGYFVSTSRASNVYLPVHNGHALAAVGSQQSSYLNAPMLIAWDNVHHDLEGQQAPARAVMCGALYLNLNTSGGGANAELVALFKRIVDWVTEPPDPPEGVNVGAIKYRYGSGGFTVQGLKRPHGLVLLLVDAEGTFLGEVGHPGDGFVLIKETVVDRVVSRVYAKQADGPQDDATITIVNGQGRGEMFNVARATLVDAKTYASEFGHTSLAIPEVTAIGAGVAISRAGWFNSAGGSYPEMEGWFPWFGRSTSGRWARSQYRSLAVGQTASGTYVFGTTVTRVAAATIVFEPTDGEEPPPIEGGMIKVAGQRYPVLAGPGWQRALAKHHDGQAWVPT